jgi:ligand-binding sensor domain-containing protein
MSRAWATWVLICAAAGGVLPVGAQEAEPGRPALELDGDRSYVLLPDDIFKDLTEGTVEAWVYPNHWDGYQRFFNFGGYQHDMGVGRPWNSNIGLQFFISSLESGGEESELVVRTRVPAREWLHLAAASGPGGMEVYLNGILLGTNASSASFSTIAATQNHIGAWHRGGDGGVDTFDGRIAEFRVWRTRRNAEQIRGAMYQRLTGTEPGLAGLWNFAGVEDGLVKDATPAANHGRLIGNARVVAAQLPAAPSAGGMEYVLELDGTSSFVELPPDIFNHLTNTTVEAWVKWRKLDGIQRFFNYGAYTHDFSIGAGQFGAEALIFGVSNNDQFFWLSVPGLVRAHEWSHVAVTSGSGGMQIYFNGMIVATNGLTYSFPGLGRGAPNYLGRLVSLGVIYDFDGQLDEFRVWSGQRTEVQIRESMFKNLTGSEPGLVGLWNFNDGTARDASTNGHHGTFNGNARVVEAPRSTSSQLDTPAILTGWLTDSAGRPVANAAIRVLHRDQEVSGGHSDDHGHYTVIVRSPHTAFDLAASAGDLGVWAMGVTCPPGQSTELNLTLAPAVSITGKVTAFDGSIIPDAGIMVVRSDAAPWEAGQLNPPGWVATTFTTNGTPGYSFLNLRPGEYRVHLLLPDGLVPFQRSVPPSPPESGVEANQVETRRHVEGEILRVEPEKPVEVDFQIAPIHKGRWRRLSTANGLPSNRTRDLQFTPDGALWIATMNGVSRFDGLKFTNLSKRDGLLDNRVFCVFAAADGALWFGTELGASRWDPVARKFQNFHSGMNGLTGGRVFDIEATPDGALWFRTREGLARYDGTSFHGLPGIPPIMLGESLTKTKALAVDRQGRVWTVTSDADLWRVDGTNVIRLSTTEGLATRNQDALHLGPDGDLWFQDNGVMFNGVTRLRGQQFDSVPTDLMVTAIHETPDGILWLGHRLGGVTRINLARNGAVRFADSAGAPNSWILQVQSGPDGAFWFATDGGIYRYEETTFRNYTRADGLPGERVLASAATTDGAVWFAEPRYPTPFLARLNPRQSLLRGSPFQVFGPEDGLRFPRASALQADTRGGLWIGAWVATSLGLQYFDPDAAARGEKPIRPPTGLGELETRGGDTAGLLFESPNTLWVGRWNQGLHRVILGARPAEAISAERIDGPTNFVGHIHRDSRGRLWTTTRGRPHGMSRIEGSNVVHFTSSSTEGELPSDTVGSLQEGPDGFLYICTEAGLVRCDGNEFVALEGTVDRPLPSGAVAGTLRDRDGLLWIASESGLFRYDGITWSSLDEEDGLVSMITRTVTQDHEGDYWIGTNKGVTRYRPTRLTPPPPELVVKTDREHRATAVPAVSLRPTDRLSIQCGGFQNATTAAFLPSRYRPWPRRTPRPPKRDPALARARPGHPVQLESGSPGDYTFFVQFIDRDLNYSEPARAFLKIFTPWYANAWIIAPGGGAVSGPARLGIRGALAGTGANGESERLREQLLEQERQARLEPREGGRRTPQSRGGRTRREGSGRRSQPGQVPVPGQHVARTAHPSHRHHRLQRTAPVGAEADGRKDDVEDITRIHDSATHLLGLINGILDLSKVEAGKMTLYLEEFDVSQMIHDVVATIEPLMSKNGNRLEVDLPEGDRPHARRPHQAAPGPLQPPEQRQ